MQKCELRRFVVNDRELVGCRSVLLLVLYCCNIHETKDLSAVGRFVAVKRLRVRCTVNEEDIINGEMSAGRSVRKTTMITIRLREIPRNNEWSIYDRNEVV